MTQTGEPEKGLFARLGDINESAPPWGVGEVALAIAVLLIGTLIIGTGITASASPSTTNPDPISFVFGWLIGLVIVFVFVLVRWRRTKERFDALKLQQGTWHPLLAIMVGLGGGFTGAVIAGLGSGSFIAPMQVLGINNDIGSLALVSLFILLVQPIAESIIFAGIAVPRLRSSLGGWAGLLTTMLPFAVYYYLVFGTRAVDSIAIWYGAIYPFIIGFTLGAVRVWSKSTLATILAQLGVGITVFIIMVVT